MQNLTFHLIGNAHLDPVWLWDWREGFNEGITTCRTVLDLMDEDPELTFIRGDSAIYPHIERTDPKTFERIRRMVAAGRWDVVGGTYIQFNHLFALPAPLSPVQVSVGRSVHEKSTMTAGRQAEAFFDQKY